MIYPRSFFQKQEKPQIYKYNVRRKKKEKPAPKSGDASGATDPSIFQGKERLTRTEFRERLRKASPVIPGTGGKGMYTKEKRVSLEREAFPPGEFHKYGRYNYRYIRPQDFRGRIKGLQKQRFYAKKQEQRIKIEREIRYLKKIGGIK